MILNKISFRREGQPLRSLGLILSITFALPLISSLGAQAQLGGLFSSSGSRAAGNGPVQATPTLPICPEATEGDSPWVPGLNCTLSGTGQATTAPTSAADGQPLNTVDPSLVTTSPASTSGPTSARGSYAGTANSGANLGGIQGRLGMSYVSWPDYLGADEGAERLALLVDLTFGQGAFLNNEDGLGWRLITLNALEAKVSVNWLGAQVFRGDTAGLSEIGNRAHFEADLTYDNFGQLYELEFSRPLSGFSGWTLTGAMTSEFLMETGVLTARYGATYASQGWMNSYYGISAEEAAASAFSTYNADAGLRDVFIDLNVDIPIGPQFGVDVSAQAVRLFSDAARAPQVESAGSPLDYRAGVGLYYQF